MAAVTIGWTGIDSCDRCTAASTEVPGAAGAEIEDTGGAGTRAAGAGDRGDHDDRGGAGDRDDRGGGGDRDGRGGGGSVASFSISASQTSLSSFPSRRNSVYRSAAWSIVFRVAGYLVSPSIMFSPQEVRD